MESVKCQLWLHFNKIRFTIFLDQHQIVAPHLFVITHFKSHLNWQTVPINHTDVVKHVHLCTRSLTHTYIAHTCQHDTKPGTPGTLITTMPSYQLLRRPVGEGGFLVVAIAAGSLPANSLPWGETRREVGGEVGRGRGQRFNRAMRCRGTSLTISVRHTNHCSP